MIELLIGLLNTLNTFSPMAVIGLLGTVIFLLVKNQKAVQQDFHTIKTNDLHELPMMVETLKEMSESLRRIEHSLTENFTYLKAKLNGRS